MNTTFPRLTCRRAFTLIELLTVIAIIGILAAIIIPTVSRVRESARRAECVSNIRQIIAAAHLFANEYKGNFPTTNEALQGIYAPAPGATHDGGLITALLPYASESKKIFYCPGAKTESVTYAFQLTKTGAEGTASGPFWQSGYYWFISLSGVLPDKPSFPQNTSGDPRRLLASCFYSGTLPHGGKLNAAFADGHVSAYDERIDLVLGSAENFKTLLPK
ncbi:MAG: prepilin-type N-terminal cleavage/methylation domain-containing protein [Opitutaceae bacterium]|jgi:general secretion pathway protein G|nr:prepilin-type N-terminal cleavage/methylation domain-containing protein [Opitutaceae bacterium]